MTRDDRPILSYSRPGGPSRLSALAVALAQHVAVASVLFFAAWVVRLPRGIWYVGHGPQWIIAFDNDLLIIGPTDRAMVLGVFPVMMLKMLVLSLPVWLSWRFLLRRRKLPRETPPLTSDI